MASVCGIVSGIYSDERNVRFPSGSRRVEGDRADILHILSEERGIRALLRSARRAYSAAPIILILKRDFAGVVSVVDILKSFIVIGIVKVKLVMLGEKEAVVLRHLIGVRRIVCVVPRGLSGIHDRAESRAAASDKLIDRAVFKIRLSFRKRRSGSGAASRAERAAARRIEVIVIMYGHAVIVILRKADDRAVITARCVYLSGVHAVGESAESGVVRISEDSADVCVFGIRRQRTVVQALSDASRAVRISDDSADAVSRCAG